LLGASEAPVKFETGGEIFAAQSATRTGGERRQRTIDTKCIPEFHAFIFGQVLLDDEILRDVPAFRIARENEFALQFARLFSAQFTERLIAGFGVAYDFLLDP